MHHSPIHQFLHELNQKGSARLGSETVVLEDCASENAQVTQHRLLSVIEENTEQISHGELIELIQLANKLKPLLDESSPLLMHIMQLVQGLGTHSEDTLRGSGELEQRLPRDPAG